MCGVLVQVVQMIQMIQMVEAWCACDEILKLRKAGKESIPP